MGGETLSGIDDMIDIKVYREYWEGVQKRIPEIKKVLPVTIDEEMSKTIQGLSKEECPVLFILIPSGTGASLSADNVRENNLCVIFLMSKYDPQRKGAYETIEEVQPVMEELDRSPYSLEKLLIGYPLKDVPVISQCTRYSGDGY